MRDAIVIGAGHAGLAASRRLREAGLDHLVLERGEIGESWRTQRWDSFALNTPSSMNVLPGAAPDGDPHGFEGRNAWIARLERYVRDQRLPVMTRKTVTAVERADAGFVVEVAGDAPIRTRTVIVASGMVNAPKVPAAAADLDDRIGRLTTGTYRRPDQLEPGAVLLVGSAQSGVQIAEDLLDAGREVYLATGNVGRMPRRMRGQDSLYWMREVGWFDERPEDLADPAIMRAAQPQISGVGAHGHTVSLQSLAARGVTLLGRLEAIAGTRVGFAQDLAEHIRYADEWSRRKREQVDAHIARLGLDAPPSEPDPADEPVRDPESLRSPSELDLADRGITTVIFTTGFGADLGWLRLPECVNDRGVPVHRHGRSPVDGLWFLGWSWLRKRQSAIIRGASEDSAHVVDELVARLKSATPWRP